MLEYGGYFPIELRTGQEYYTGENVLSFNCARSAIEFIVDINHYKIIYLPHYLCESVKKTLEKHDIDIRFYHIDEEFRPLLDAIEDAAVIVITNYFGVKSNDEQLVRAFGNVIFDNTQAFFEKPISGTYNIYSCRKFLGVCDGAYLVTNKLLECNTRYKVYNPRNIRFLIEPYISTTNTGYTSSIENERQLSEDGIRDMSNLSRMILESVDYDYVMSRRIENYEIVRKNLENINDMVTFRDDGSVPMIYPLLIKNKDVRDKLVKSKIYVPQWWKYLLQSNCLNEFERLLSEYLLPIPIDQRYSAEQIYEMTKRIIKIVSQ